MRRAPLLLAAVILISACTGGDVTANGNPSYLQVRAEATRTSAELKDLAALRQATDKFHTFSASQDAGWNTQFPEGCFSSPDGAMGYHYLKGENVGTLDPTKPQFVMYEPQKNGKMRLVGVEFIYPGRDSDPVPSLFGQDFSYNYTFSVWALHVWAWTENPDGMYANWNKRVSCTYAAASAVTMNHT